MSKSKNTVFTDPTWNPPDNTAFILIWRMQSDSKNYQGLCSLSEELKKVNAKAYKGKMNNGLDIILIGAEFVERKLTFSEKSWDEALGGIFKKTDFIFSDVKKDVPEYIKYRVYWIFNGVWKAALSCRPPIIIDENTVLIPSINGDLKICSDNLRFYSIQIRPDDSSQFDLENLPQFDNSSPLIPSE